jgi:hypothetical protein
MAVNTILNKSLTTFNQTDYLLKCDLLNKYLIKNIYDIPQYTSISIKYKNSFLFLENNINKFQVILFFYFILTYLPIILYKPDTNKTVSLKLKLIDNQKIKILLENLMLENVIVLKKKLKKSVFKNEIFNQKKNIDFKLVFSVQNLYINNELNLIFNDLYISNLERITLYTSFNINRALYNKLLGSSKEDFLKNFLYFWSF